LPAGVRDKNQEKQWPQSKEFKSRSTKNREKANRCFSNGHQAANVKIFAGAKKPLNRCTNRYNVMRASKAGPF